MILLKNLLGLACLCASSFGAALSVSVGFPSAPETPGCSKTITNNVSAVCSAGAGDSQGTALASIYKNDLNGYVVLGALHATQSNSSATTVKSSLSVQVDEFQNLPVHGVTVTHNCTIDCEPIQVLANGNAIGTLWGKDSLDVPRRRTPLTITIYAIENTTTPGTDYVGLFDVSLVPY